MSSFFPQARGRPVNGRIGIPDSSSLARTARAIAGAPGLSPWRQIVVAGTGRETPLAATTA